ncbi:MAG: cohesin domain-containing protein [Patescibacteria group bacterium]
MESFQERRSTLTLILLVILLAGLVVAATLVRYSQELRKKAAATTTLEITPAAVTINQGEEFNLNVTLATGDKLVTKADITVTYDPKYLEGVSVNPGTLFPTVEATGIIQNGIANIVLSAPTTSPVTGTGTVMSLTFRSRNPTSATPVIIDQISQVLAVGESGNVLLQRLPAMVVVNQTVFPATRLGFAPAQLSVTAGTDFDLSITMDTGGNQVTNADLTILYDADLLEGTSFDKTDFLPTTLSAGTNTQGAAKIVLGSTLTAARMGQGTVAVARFRAKKNGQATLAISDTTRVGAIGSDENMLAQKGTATIDIGNTAGNPTPNPTPQATPPIGGACIKNAPLAPTGVQVDSEAETAVTLYWQESLYATSYGVVYGRTPGKYEYGAADVGYTTSLRIGNLAPNTRYYFAVFAVNDCAPSGYSVETQAKTLFRNNSSVGTSSPLPSPAVDAEEPVFIPLPEDAENPFIFSQSGSGPSPSILPIYPVGQPSPSSQVKSSGNPFLSPLGAILLIVAGIFAGIFFWRMRKSH